MSFRTNALKVQAFAGAMYGIQVGTTTMAQVNADITSAGGLANALNGYYTSSFGSVANATVGTTVATNLGLTGDALTSGAAYITAQLNAAAPGARGAVISTILDLFAGLTADATYGAFATAYNTKVDAANAYTGTDNVAIGTVVATSSVFTLTTGADIFTGTSANDTFNAYDTTATTWSVGDAINGGEGTDTLNIVRAALIASAPVGSSVTNVETANVTSGSTLALNTSTWTGLTALNGTGVGGTTLTAAATTDVVLVDTAMVTATDAGVTVNGGKNVTLTLTAADATTDADTVAEVAVGATSTAAGTVAVTLTGKYADGANNTMSGIAVTGGTTVSVTTATGLTAAQIVAEQTDTTNFTITQSAISVTGNSVTTAVTVNQAASVTEVDTANIGRIGVVGGAVEILDANSASTTGAGTITTATLNNAGAATVNSGALTTLNLSGKLTSVDAGTLGALTTAANTALALNLTGAVSTGAVTIDSDIKTLNISGNTTASTLASLVASGATTLNVSGDAKVTLTANTAAAVTAINVTNTGGFALGGTAIGTTTTFTGGDGADAVILPNGFTKAITMGAGESPRVSWRPVGLS